MPKLNDILQDYTTEMDREDFLWQLFKHIESEIKKILTFGPCNSDIAEKTATKYYAKRDITRPHRFFSTKYLRDETQSLPAVIANIHLLRANKRLDGSAQERFIKHLQDGFIYGTGTCEVYSIVGAYVLAQHYDVSLSIETIYSSESHTYIRLHTSPEYIFDFWGQLMCNYTDTLSWNEFHGERYLRNHTSRVQHDISFQTSELLVMQHHVLNDEVRTQRERVIREVMDEVNKEILSAPVSIKPML